MDKMYRVPKPVVVKNHIKFRRINLGETALPLKLAIELNDAPSVSQIAEAFESINAFISRLIGGVMASGDSKANDPKVSLALNAAAQLHQSGEMFTGSSPIARPQMVPRPQ